MKVCLFFFALLSIGMCATLLDLVKNEVSYLYQMDSGLTVDQCVTKCDALFDLIAGHDEDRSDRACQTECDCQKNNNCHHDHNNHPGPGGMAP